MNELLSNVTRSFHMVIDPGKNKKLVHVMMTLAGGIRARPWFLI